MSTKRTRLHSVNNGTAMARGIGTAFTMGYLGRLWAESVWGGNSCRHIIIVFLIYLIVTIQ